MAVLPDDERFAASQAPRLKPLSYPGVWPESSVVITADALWDIRDRDGDVLAWERTPAVRLGACRLRTGEEPTGTAPTLNRTAEALHFMPTDARVPVISIGSNASPAQLRFKFADAPELLFIPSVRARVRGVAVGYTSFVSSFGYVPATVFPDVDAELTLAVQFLDLRQLRTVDDSEIPHYRRVWLGAEQGVQITLETGEQLAGAYAYVAREGLLTDASSVPLTMAVPGSPRNGALTQRQLLDRLRRASLLEAATGTRSAEELAQFAQAVRAAGRVRAENPFFDLPDAVGGSPRRYGQMLPAGAAADVYEAAPGEQVAWACATPDGLERGGTSIVRLNAEDRAQLGNPDVVVLRSAALHLAQGDAAPAALATVLPEQPDAPPLPPRGQVEVDHVLRMACGLERGDALTLRPARVERPRWADGLLGRPTSLTLRVTLAEPTTAERDVILLGRLAIDVLGVSSGDYIVLEGMPDDTGRVRSLVVKVFEVPGEVEDNRRQITGGVWGARFPSASDTLGIHPDLPMAFMDAELRARLGIHGQTLATVRARPGRLHQFFAELREMLLVLAVAFLGIVVAVPSVWIQGLLIAVLLGGSIALVISRMRRRLSHRRSST